MATSSLLHNVPFNRAKGTESYESKQNITTATQTIRSERGGIVLANEQTVHKHTCAHKQTDELFYSPSTTAGQTSDRSAHCKIPLLSSFHHLLFRPHYLEKQTNSRRHM